MDIAVMIILGLFGLALGSFACCQAWRIQKEDKTKRSHCMNCDYQLKWYDNIPLISWIMLGGKCRKCHKRIGVAEPLAELGLATAFVLSFLFWPHLAELKAGNAFEIIKYALFLIQLVLFALMFVYDAKWKEMPTKVLIASCIIGALFWAVNFVKIITNYGFEMKTLVSLAGAMMILPGFYYFMYKASKENWVGSGDAILCVPLAFMLGNFWLGMFCLFASNIIGSITMLPVVIAKKEKHAMIPFGPFLMIGFLVIYFCQEYVLNFVRV